MITIIRKFVEIIIYGNVWISLGAVALTLNTFLVMDWEINKNLLSLVFFATVLSYCFQRVVRHTSDATINSNRHQWVFNQKNILYVFITISSCVSAYLFFTLFTLYDLVYFLPLIAIALFYAVKMFSKSLRDVPSLKIILIAFSWAAVTVLIPAYLNQELTTNKVCFLFILNFTYIFALVIPFDIRDLSFDESDKKTIPQLIGMKPAKLAATFLLIACCIISVLLLEHAMFLIPVYIVSALLMINVNEKRKEFYYAFGIDGLILLFPISTWIVKSYL